MPATTRTTQTWKHRMNRGDVVVLTLACGHEFKVGYEGGRMVRIEHCGCVKVPERR